MNCPKCHNNKSCKDGIVHGRQRYKCKSCNYRYTVEKKSDIKSPEVRRLALEMYLEGMGFRSIGRILKISHATVFYWIKERGSKAELPQSASPVEIVEPDEIHTCVGSKKTTDGYGLLLTDLEDGTSLLSVDTAPHERA